MYKVILTFLFFIFAHALQAQIKALTENGRQALLYDNGTWKYLPDSTSGDNVSTEAIKTNAARFVKSADQTFQLKSTRTDFSVYLNPQRWTVMPHLDNERQIEYRFSNKSGDGLVMMITEKTPIPVENLSNVALLNAQKASADAAVTRKEYRMVNGHKVLYLEMSATIQGIKLRYLGYYFSDASGTVQLVGFTSEALYNAEKAGLEAFINGLTATSKS